MQCCSVKTKLVDFNQKDIHLTDSLTYCDERRRLLRHYQEFTEVGMLLAGAVVGKFYSRFAKIGMLAYLGGRRVILSNRTKGLDNVSLKRYKPLMRRLNVGKPKQLYRTLARR